MPRRITADPKGFWLVDSETGSRIGGPYETYGAASDANLALGDQPDRAQAELEIREALKPANLKASVAQANETPSILASRGRPADDRSIPYRIALEVFVLWRVAGAKQGDDPSYNAMIIAAVAKQFHRSRRFVRRCVREYHALKHDETELLEQLRGKTLRPDLRAPEQAAPPLPRLQGATLFLHALLSRGPLSVKDIYHLGQNADLSKRTMVRAKKELGIQSIRSGAVRQWKLPPNR
jgi:hypothetical protein